MLRKLLVLISISIMAPLIGVAYEGKKEQPVNTGALALLPIESVDSVVVTKVAKNEEVLQYVEAQGRKLAPSYKSVVCTDYVINVLKKFYKLTPKERQDIQILTSKKSLKALIKADAPIIKGVHTALVNSGRGVPVKRKDVQPGDFVQFWFVWKSGAYGHCGVVKSIGDKTLTLYSSRPKSNGFSVHTYPFPHKAYFVRLK